MRQKIFRMYRRFRLRLSCPYVLEKRIFQETFQLDYIGIMRTDNIQSMKRFIGELAHYHPETGLRE